MQEVPLLARLQRLAPWVFRYFRSHVRETVVVSFLILNAGMVGLYWRISQQSQLAPSAQNTQRAALAAEPNPADFPEIQELQEKPLGFVELSEYFRKVSAEKGSLYAWNLLRIAPTPPNVDFHLLGHLIGDEMYKEYGFEAIGLCTDDFRNACSHTVVIGLFLEEGVAAVDKVQEACMQAPGGKGAYSMCFHGVGHGVLAYTDYNLEEAVELCKKMSSAVPNGREIEECIGGTIMEMNAGIHDREAWEEQWPNYYSYSKPLSPCDQDFIPDSAKSICYSYQTPHLFVSAGADLGMPSVESIQRAFTFCASMPAGEELFQDECYGGFGKEFVVLAQDRDIRKVEQITDVQLQKVIDWCELSGSARSTSWCLGHAVNSLYWGGENPPEPAVRLCSLIADEEVQSNCFAEIEQAVSYYAYTTQEREHLCSILPGSYQEKCTASLLGGVRE